MKNDEQEIKLKNYNPEITKGNDLPNAQVYNEIYDENRRMLIKKILNRKEISDKIEQAIDELIEEKLSKDSDDIFQKVAVGSKLSDSFARAVGSWKFIIIFIIMLFFWTLLNLIGVFNFDKYPFILLNLVLSCIAAIQAPIIMMSQNRSDEKDRNRSENDYKVNLKSEILLEDIHYRLEKILKNQEELKKQNHK